MQLLPVVDLTGFPSKRNTVISHSEIKCLFQRLKSRHQRRHIQKYFRVSDNEKQVPY